MIDSPFYFSELPDHLLTNELAAKFEDASAIKDPQQQEEAFSSLIEQLPVLNKLLLSWLMVHIDHVIEKVCSTINAFIISKIILEIFPIFSFF